MSKMREWLQKFRWCHTDAKTKSFMYQEYNQEEKKDAMCKFIQTG